MKANFDKTDLKIIDLLIDNSRLSYRKIAQEIGNSVATVMKRVKKLEKSGIITKYTIGIDYAMLGYDSQVIIDIRVKKGILDKVEESIALHPNVESVYDNTGSFDATVIAKFKSRAGVDSFLKKIQKYEFIERTNTKILLSTIKSHPIKVST